MYCLIRREAILAKEIYFDEDLQIEELEFLLILVLFALDYREVKHLSLILLVVVESTHVGADLLDLHAVGHLIPVHVDFVVGDYLL